MIVRSLKNFVLFAIIFTNILKNYFLNNKYCCKANSVFLIFGLRCWRHNSKDISPFKLVFVKGDLVMRNMIWFKIT